jgi:hypothetical protein
MGKAQQQTGERQATRSLIVKTIVKKSLPKATIARIKDAVLEKWRLLKLIGENEKLMQQLTSASSSPGAEGSRSGSKKRAASRIQEEFLCPAQVGARLQRALTSHRCLLTR